MKVRYGKEVANHSGPESCSDAREGVAEALIGETGRPGKSREIRILGCRRC